MPTYEYRCRDCGREFEVFQRMSDRPGAPCPDCGRRADRLISGGAGFLFRGDGFYITDHRSEEYRRRARQEADGGGGEKAPPVPAGPDGPEPRGDPAPAGSASEPGNGVAGDEST
ncbi:MAG: zinc ribbon domain-containing protein [Gemmatimonadota bacterium]|nr:zinc ribbon domain-containing protein [Gemmatimonadota bacterium]MDE2870686.1 zinc ribbon domain-containing protein [Gemmatimonadota bacterium]